MENFSYYNIFDTKGIEYLAIIAFFLLLIPFWIVLNKKVKINNPFKGPGILSANLLRIPQGIFYSRNHTWAFLEKSGNAKLGIDDLLLKITGEVSIRPLKKPGENVHKGDLLAKIDQNGKSLNIFSPVSGQIIHANPVISEQPDILYRDPYGSGWIYKIQPTNWLNEISSLYLAGEATHWLRQELNRYKDFIAKSTQENAQENTILIMQDGGELSENSLSLLPDKHWQRFQKDFLNNL